MAGETIILDASALSPAPASRVQLDITPYVAAAGPDWGDGAISAYMSDQAVGSSPVDYRLPNRIINIPLILKTVSGTSFSVINTQLQQKVATFQREGGWILRQFGSTNLYADVVNATLHLGGAWLQAYKDADIAATLQLECIPDWYGDEVTLDTLGGTCAVSSVLLSSGGTAVVAGDHGGRVRFQVSDTSANDQHALLWGVRSRNYSGSATAALSYEAEALTALNGAGTLALSGASGGSAVIGTSFPAGAWVSMLYSTLTAGAAPMTHVGSYRVWARCYSTATLPQFRLRWGAGGLSVPVTNDPARLPGTAAFYLMDLGPVSIQAPPVGPSQWSAVIETQIDTTNAQTAIDRIFFQPLDESAGQLTYVNVPPASSISVTSTAGAGADNSGTGTLTWSGTANITNPSSYATATGPGTTHYLFATSFGFAVPTSATIVGIGASLIRQGSAANSVLDAGVFLLKAGAVVGSNKATAGYWPTAPTATSYGAASDLWGTTWTAAQVNASNFGIALSAQIVTSQNAYAHGLIAITIYYVLASGFTIAADSVIYASKTLELRTEGMYRSDSGGTVFGPVSQVTGDLPRIPPSGLENRPIQVFIKPSRGDLDTLPDGGLDGLSVVPKVRPSFLFRP